VTAIVTGAVLWFWPTSHARPPALGVIQPAAGTTLVTFGTQF